MSSAGVNMAFALADAYDLFFFFFPKEILIKGGRGDGWLRPAEGLTGQRGQLAVSGCSDQ